jgi:peptidoglycan/xylan/chitin deacetylase (PgdA/CDA1 family)
MLVIQREILGLCYHTVSAEKLPHIQHLYPYKTPEMFEADLIYLAKNFNLITYAELVGHVWGGRRLKPKSVILTFDDGLAECYSVVRPLLLKYGVPCVFFVPTGYIDNRSLFSDHKVSICMELVASLEHSHLTDVLELINTSFDKSFSSRPELQGWLRSLTTSEHSLVEHLCTLLNLDQQIFLTERTPYMTLDEIKCLSADGFTIGAHSVDHRNQGTRTQLEIEHDIADSCWTIRTLTGNVTVPYAFPFSADGVSRDLLRSLYMRYDHLGLFFDTHGIRRESNFLISRMSGDHLDGSARNKSNLPYLMAKAFQEELAVVIRSF